MGQQEIIEWFHEERKTNDDYVTVKEIAIILGLNRQNVQRQVNKLYAYGVLEEKPKERQFRLKKRYIKSG